MSTTQYVIRKRATLLALLALVALFTSSPTRAAQPEGAWQTLGGPIAFATHIAGDPTAPDFIFLFISLATSRNNDRTQAANGYVIQSWAPYFSTDAGATWQPASNDLAEMEPTALQIVEEGDASVIWVGTAEHGLWRSDNRGRTWRAAIVPGLENQRVLALSKDPRGDLHMLAIDNARQPNSYLYTSRDDGFNWDRRLLQGFSNEPEKTVTDLIADPFEFGRLYAVTLGGVLVSADGGFSWNRSAFPLPADAQPGGRTVLTVDPTQRGRLYAVNRFHRRDGVAEIGVYRSLDGGESWELLRSRFYPSELDSTARALRPIRLRLDPFNRRRLYLAANNGLWLSTDAGLSWRLAGSALDGVTVADVYLHPRQRGRWLAIGAGGVWRTANAGGRWQSLSNGLPPASRVQSVVAVPGDPRVLLMLNGGALPSFAAGQPLWRSTNGGRTWLPAMRGLAGVSVQRLLVNPKAPNMVYGLANDGLVRSVDRGRSWRYFHLPVTPRDLAFGAKPGSLFLATLDGLWHSTDNGESWRPLSLEGPVQAVANSPDGDIFAIAVRGGEGPTVYRSSDEGAQWQAVAAPPPGEISRLIAHPQTPDFLIALVRWGGIYVSPDGGFSWARRDSGIPKGVRWRGPAAIEPDGPNVLALAIDPENPAHWWAARDGGGVYESVDAGVTWEDVSADLGDALIFSFAYTADGLVAGASNIGLIARRPTAAAQTVPDLVDARIEILWPHDFAPVEQAKAANLGLRLYRGRSQEVPPCAWQPPVEVWMARDAEPLRLLGEAEQRNVEGHPFPFWELNDVDVTWANDPTRKLIFLARVAPGLAESAASPWIHAADARTLLPNPPEPIGLTKAPPAAIDAIIRVVWPHNELGAYAPPEEANWVNISAVLFERDTRLALAEAHLPERVWLIGALDNQVGRRLAVGERRVMQGNGFEYFTYEFNDIDVSLARLSEHHWTFWLEIPGMNAASNVWVHGIDARTRAPSLLEPIAGCSP
ncbi:MAG: hypothetical protein GXP42_11550 [Chloroflexi bacterium]|nr:hypothetical protein [Chloroflexota bacterium]